MTSDGGVSGSGRTLQEGVSNALDPLDLENIIDAASDVINDNLCCGAQLVDVDDAQDDNTTDADDDVTDADDGADDDVTNQDDDDVDGSGDGVTDQDGDVAESDILDASVRLTVDGDITRVRALIAADVTSRGSSVQQFIYFCSFRRFSRRWQCVCLPM